MMKPAVLLLHIDCAQLWPWSTGAIADGNLDRAYQLALEVRALRIARGETPVGIKIGFTNRTIWPLYNVHAPIWGTVWDTTVHQMQGESVASISGLCQPRIEPEVVFGLRHAPGPNPSMQQLFEAIDWVAPGFELVQSHLPDWKFVISDTAADSGLHGQLWIGQKTPVGDLASDAQGLTDCLAQAKVELFCNDVKVHDGQGANVLDSPLHALFHVCQVLAACSGGPELAAGDVITTGTWTDAPPIKAGQTWRAMFDFTPAQIGLTIK
ncbi:MAG: fumarylacetoacetate hydrolase family protein [Orrella sp.]|jgi:2-keto-4-pentenoate hydratase|uniref:2-keto-4-pentenoate hydratase n=1 Tax=Orrella sp. TaxID=1921583 RepID=UPI003BDBCB1A